MGSAGSLPWDFHAKKKGGTATQKDKSRNKAFEMVKHSKAVKDKNNWTDLKRNRTAKKHRKTMDKEGRGRKRRRR